MKKNKIIYWVSTMLIALASIQNGISHFIDPQYFIDSFNHLGYPQYLRYEMAIASILGALVLVLPKTSERLKEWAYFGFGLIYISAFYAHISVGDDFLKIATPIVFLLTLLVSYYFNYKNKQNNEKR
jgi:uncharacterized membrane protein